MLVELSNGVSVHKIGSLIMMRHSESGFCLSKKTAWPSCPTRSAHMRAAALPLTAGFEGPHVVRDIPAAVPPEGGVLEAALNPV